MYKAIIFDLGNVLLNFDYNIIINSLNNVEPGLGNKFEKLYYENYQLHEDLEKDKISVAKFTEIILFWLEKKVSPEQFYNIYSDMFNPNKDVINLLPILKNKYKLYLLSNTNYIHQKYGWEQYEFLKHFDKLILSHEVKARKPEREIFTIAQKIVDCSPSHIFFTDDIPEYVNAAKSAGWDAVQFVGYSQLVNDLKSRNII